MKWIKASERLPNNFEDVCLKVSRMPNFGFYDGSQFKQNDPAHNETIPLGVTNIEWLDESESPSTPILGAEEALEKIAGKEWMADEGKIAIGIITEAMQTHSAQYRDECERLREENKKLEERIPTANPCKEDDKNL